MQHRGWKREMLYMGGKGKEDVAQGKEKERGWCIGDGKERSFKYRNSEKRMGDREEEGDMLQ